tara:strand:- start:2719 stop:3402 length:684 start_codon:yes stop_codon:yes gene_type:complete
MILFIDTAFDKTLLAIKSGNEIYYKEIIENNFISKNIINSVDELIKKTNSKKNNFKYICFNNGPGNFTSLRVGLSYTKAISFYLNIPVITLNSFQILALSSNVSNKNIPIFVAIDARMDELYWTYYKNYNEIIASENKNYLSSEKFFFRSLEELSFKKILLIKNSPDILKSYEVNDPNIEEIEKNSSMQKLNNIFKYIELLNKKNFLYNSESINLNYIRDNVANKTK